MDNIKYQVFVSSTYSDLTNERKGILNVLLMADCIPAGMENFVATDDEQFNVIKQVIDLCDYYILIIGKRYGSINEKTGISYTEMEYNYAIEQGIPVLVFAIDDTVALPDDKVESDDIKKGKLAEFKIKAMGNRLASVWKDASDLMGKVAISIMQAKTQIKRPGWHRGNDTEKEQLIKRITALEEELENAKNNTFIDDTNGLLDEKFYGVTVSLHFTERVMCFTSNTVIHKKDVTVTLDELFKFVSLRISGNMQTKDFVNAVSAFQSGYYVEEQGALIVKNKFEQLGLIEIAYGKNDSEIIKLTQLGKDVMNELNS